MTVQVQTITISDGQTTAAIPLSEHIEIDWEPKEFRSWLEATWFYVDTDVESLIADRAHMSEGDWQLLWERVRAANEPEVTPEVTAVLAMTEAEAQQVSGYMTLEILGNWYKATDIEDICWDSGEYYYSATDFYDHGNRGFLDNTYYVYLVDGTELEVDPNDPNTDHEMIQEWIDPM
jgi:hypothetical protein